MNNHKLFILVVNFFAKYLKTFDKFIHLFKTFSNIFLNL